MIVLDLPAGSGRADQAKYAHGIICGPFSNIQKALLHKPRKQ